MTGNCPYLGTTLPVCNNEFITNRIFEAGQIDANYVFPFLFQYPLNYYMA